MNRDEFNPNSLDNGYFCVAKNLEYNKCNEVTNDYNSQIHKKKAIERNNNKNIFKLLCMSLFFITIIKPLISPLPKVETEIADDTINDGNDTNEDVVTNITKFNSLTITYQNNFVCYQLDYLDENSYWSNFVIIFNLADGTKAKKDLITGQEKELFTTNYKKTDLISIYILCDNTGNNDLEYNEEYDKSIIYTYIFE